MGLTQVSTDGVKNDAITKTKIPANQIEASELADNAVDTNAIADQAVALSKLPHGDGSSDGKFLRANNGATPSFETVSIPAGTTINNNADNRVITGSGTANTLEGEADLTYDGTNLSIPNGINHTGDTNTAIRFPAADTIAMESAGGEIFRITPDESHGSGQSIRLKSANTVDGASVQTGGTKAYSSGIPRGQVNIMDYQAYNVTDNGGAIAFGARYNSSNAHTTMASIEGVKHNNIDGNYQGAIAFKTRNNGGDNLIRMRLTDNGLCFGTDTAGANALDDYEEGNWTPTLEGTTTTGTVSYQARTGKYVKIGKVVTWELYIAFSNGTGSGTIHISGLPFTVANNGTYPAVNIGYVHNYTLRSDHILTGLHASGSSYLYFYERPNGGGANLQPNYDGSGALIMSGHYEVA